MSTKRNFLLKKIKDAHSDPIYCCACVNVERKKYSRMFDQYVITGGLDCRVRIWKLKNNTLDLLHTLKGHTVAVISIAVSPKGLGKHYVNSNNQVFASVSLDSKILLWDLIKAKKLKKINLAKPDAWSLAFSSDGYFIISGRFDGNLNVTNIVNNSVEKEICTKGKSVLTVASCVDGEYIACGSNDGNIYIFDNKEHKLLHTLNLHSETVRCVNFAHYPATNLTVSGSNDGFVKIYDIKDEATVCSLQLKSWVMSVCFSPDNRSVAIATADGVVRIALAKDLSILKTFKKHNGIVTSVNFCSDCTTLISVAKDKSINLYKCEKMYF